MGFNNVDVMVSGPNKPSSTYKTKVLKGNHSFASQVTEPNMKYVIKHDFDLGDEEVAIPYGCILEFDGGSLSNGILEGNKTQIVAATTSIFTNININGTWNVSEITSAWFSNVTETNILKQVFNLTDNSVSNHVIVEAGNYNVAIDELYCIQVKSNTRVTLFGHITLEGNSLERYYIFDIREVDNVIFDGNGVIEGDVLTHNPIIRQDAYGNDYAGEWGYGIRVACANNVKIDGLTICNCWGDSICISSVRNEELPMTERTHSEDIEISNVTLYGSRRQGISAVVFKRLKIENCNIHDIVGDELIPRGPSSAIDIEPDSELKGAECCVIDNIHVNNCKKGIDIKGGRSNDYAVFDVILSNSILKNIIGGRAVYVGNYVRNVSLQNLIVDSASENALNISSNCRNIDIKNCDLSSFGNTLFVGDDDESEPTDNYSLSINNVSCTNLGTRYAVFIRTKHCCIDNSNFASQTGADGCVRIKSNSFTKIENSTINGNIVYLDSSISKNAIKNCTINCEEFTVDNNYKIENCSINANKVLFAQDIDVMNSEIKIVNPTNDDYSITTNSRCSIKDSIIKGTLQVGFRNNILNNLIIGTYTPKKYLIKLANTYSIFSENRIYYNPNEGEEQTVESLLVISESINKIVNNIFAVDNVTNAPIYLATNSNNVQVLGNLMRYTSDSSLPLIRYNNSSVNANITCDFTYKGNTGNTSNRPLLSSSRSCKGYQYFDTDLGKPIYWNGTAWVDATGATV